MKISLDWLSDFVTFTEKDPQNIAEQITACVAEVEEVEEQGAILKHCCVGKVLTVEKHPGADKLSLCDVQTDKGTKRVVCGGTNLRVGMRVAFANIGAVVRWHGEEMMELKPVKIRGEESHGMICAAEELDLSAQFPAATGHSIVDLGDGDDGVGKDLRSYLNLNDTVLHIDNHAITNRADLFSHVGFARECVAIGIAKWKKKPEYKEAAFTNDSLPFALKVDCKDLIPRYCACMLKIDGLGETPDWMRKRLEATGWRSVNLPVDITNYVSMEVGMPLHSFDAADLKGAVHMRTSKQGEYIVTLDKEERELPAGAIVISDDEGIFDLLGIMGGLRSSTKEGTTNVFLHSAVVDPVSIRNAIIATGHRTDASTVYEKGIPPVAAKQGILRALELFLEHVPGAAIVSKLDEWGDDGQVKPIPFSVDRCNSLLGTTLTAKEMTSLLTNLEFEVTEKGDGLMVTPPLHRIGDIHGAHDLVEEVGRVYGYNTIDPVMPVVSMTPPQRDFRVRRLRHALKERGFIEFLPLSLLGPELLQRAGFNPSDAAEIENPIGTDLSLLQPSALPQLLQHAQENMEHGASTLRTFHLGTVFTDGADSHRELGLLVAPKRKTSLAETPFLILKRDLLSALNSIGYAADSSPLKKTEDFMHPGRSAELTIGKENIGTLFELHPAVRTRFDLSDRTAVALLNISALLNVELTVIVAKSLPQFPAVSYDVTVTLDQSATAGDLLKKAAKSSDLLETVDIVDVYAKESGGKYNLTVRCTYRAQDRTLKEEEAKKEHEVVTGVLQKA